MAFYMPPLVAESDPVAGPAVTAEETARIAADLLKQDAATAATDVELALKQDAATAATDVELAAAVSAVTTALAAKQDLSTAATDAEVAAVQSSLTTAIAGVQSAVDALGAAGATDAELAAAVAALAATVATDIELSAGLDLVRTRITPGGGEETIALSDVTTSRSLATGVMKVGLFKAQETRVMNNIVLANLTAGAGMTLCRAGVYSVNTTDFSLTALLAATANDPTVWATTNGEYSRALTTPFSKVEGTWYAVGELQVGGSSPTVPAMILSLAQFADATHGRARRVGLVSGLTDLPPSVAAGSLGTDTGVPYMLLKP